MNATAVPVAPSPTANADPRADFMALMAAYPTTFQTPEYQLHNSRSLAACCGAAVLNNEGKRYSYTGGGNISWLNPILTEDDRKEINKWIEEWYAPRKSSFSRYTDKEYAEFAKRAWDDYRFDKFANAPGVTMGIGLSMTDCIAAMYTPDHELYGKVQGLEFNDKEHGLVSLIWTNA